MEKKILKLLPVRPKVKSDFSNETTRNINRFDSEHSAKPIFKFVIYSMVKYWYYGGD